MKNLPPHSFHIPVMGLGYTIDTPVKVARFGIASVVSIIEDQLIEQMREIHCRREQENYIPITDQEPGYRARRITEYLNLLDRIVQRQIREIKALDFSGDNDLVKYFELLDDSSPLRKLYLEMRAESSPEAKLLMQRFLKDQLTPGAIDVNVMTKTDRQVFFEDGITPFPYEHSDALTALRGFALSTLNSSIVFSAGLNPRLFSYCETFADFFPTREEGPRKKIILKVSDYRSAYLQGKILAKKGLWISEFRIESGLNCGGHAFPSDGLLLGPVLEEFREKKEVMAEELFKICQEALVQKGFQRFGEMPEQRITVQGGIGTSDENRFLLEHYQLDGTGWGSPFLMVPEATNVDEDTLQRLIHATEDDYYLSHASPLGVPFNNFRKSSAEAQRRERIDKGRPGSPCYKKFLAFSTEFSSKSICTASREYQNLKLRELDAQKLPEAEHQAAFERITEKDCLCEGLGAAALIKNGATDKLRVTGVTICPGPNLAYFSGMFSLRQMVDHIYGRQKLTNQLNRPHMFVKELLLNVDFLEHEIKNSPAQPSEKYARYLRQFRNNLLNGIAYYQSLLVQMKHETEEISRQMEEKLLATGELLRRILPA